MEVYVHIATQEAMLRVSGNARSAIDHLKREAEKPEYQEGSIRHALLHAIAGMENDCAIVEGFVKEVNTRRENGR